MHAGEPMAGHAAEIDEVSGLVGAECDRRAGAFSGHARRRGVLVGEYDVVLRPFAVDQSELNHLSLNGGQDRIDLAVDRATLADIRHPPVRDPRTQGVPRVGNVGDVGAGCGLRRRCRARLAVWVSAAAGEGCCGRSRGLCAACACCEIGDHVGSVMIGLEARKRHLVSRHDLRRIGQVLVERLGIPRDISRFHRRRIIVAGLRSRLAADDAGQRRAEHVLAGLDGMAGLAFPEDQTARGGIALRRSLRWGRAGGGRRRIGGGWRG